MFKSHVITDFSPLGENEIGPTATVAANSLTTNGALFVGLPITGAIITGLIGTYTTILGKPNYAGKAADLSAARTPLEAALKTNGIWINQNFAGNDVMLAKTGYPLAKAHEPADPLAKGKLDAAPTKKEGELTFEVNDVPNARGFLICYTPVTNAETDPMKWTWAWSPTRKGLLTDMGSATKYKLRSVGLGTDPTLTFSDEITRTPQ